MVNITGEGGRGGFGGRGRGGRGRGRGGDRGRGRGGRDGDKDKEWVPVTKLGRLVQAGKIKKIEEIFLFSMPIKEHQIVDLFLPGLKDEVMKVMPVQKQTTAGQRTRFKAFVCVGDFNGHIGYGDKCSREVAGAIAGALMCAKINIVPVRRGYWGSTMGLPHTVPMKVTGQCGSERVRLIPAPRGTGLVAAPVPKKLLAMAGVDDVYTSTTGHSRTLGNFVKAVFYALKNTYGYLSPELWTKTHFTKTPIQEFSDFLSENSKVRTLANESEY
jgi:small subunit ribosomal protein S2e